MSAPPSTTPATDAFLAADAAATKADVMPETTSTPEPQTDAEHKTSALVARQPRLVRPRVGIAQEKMPARPCRVEKGVPVNPGRGRFIWPISGLIAGMVDVAEQDGYASRLILSGAAAKMDKPTWARQHRSLVIDMPRQSGVTTALLRLALRGPYSRPLLLSASRAMAEDLDWRLQDVESESDEPVNPVAHGATCNITSPQVLRTMAGQTGFDLVIVLCYGEAPGEVQDRLLTDEALHLIGAEDPLFVFEI